MKNPNSVAPTAPYANRAASGAGAILLAFALALPACAASPAKGAPAGPPYQATGVKVGEVAQTSAIVWARLTRNPARLKQGVKLIKAPKDEVQADPEEKGKNALELPPGASVDEIEGAVPGAPGEARVVYWAQGQEAKKIETPWKAVGPDHDFACQFRLQGLSPNTEYGFRVECRAAAQGPEGPAMDGRFRTAPAPDEPARVVFTVVTGQEYFDRDGEEGHKIYPQMAALKPSFFVHTGDIVYYDGHNPIAKSIELARYKWNRIYGLPLLIEFHRVVPSYFIKDDHDTWQNDCWPTLQNNKMGDFTFKQGQAVFLDEVPMGESTYRTVRWGKDLQIWLPEGRDFRSPNTMPDGPDKTIWGAEQKAWFKKTVQDSDAAFRVLISPTPIVGPDREAKADNHANKAFATEGKEIRQFVSAQKNMVIVCGDRHWQYMSVDPETGAREYSCGPTTDKHSGGFKEKVEAYHRYFKVCGGFLSATVERLNGLPTLVFRHHYVDGQVLFEDRLTAE